MPTLRTVTVKSAGGDYTSISAAEAGEQGDLVTLDRQLDIECYASAAGDSTQCTINGSTTDSTRYIRVICPAGERHAGIWNAAKYHISVTTSGSPGGCITCSDDFTRIEYLQARNTRASPPDFNGAIYVDAVNCLVNACLGRDGFNSFDIGAGGNEIRNSIGYGGTNTGCKLTGAASGASFAYNGTFIGGTYGMSVDSTVNYAVAKNVYVHGTTFGFGPSAGGIVTKVNCTSSDTTATNNSGGGGATNCTDSIAHSTANFTNVTAGSEDYHIPTGSALKDDGVDLSGQFTIDIDGDTRGATWDVGADEFVAAVGGGINMIHLNTVAA